MSKLVGLDLSYCKRPTDDGLLALFSLTSITSLSLRGCGRTAPVRCFRFAALQHMSQLRRLSLEDGHCFPLALLPLASLTSLTELNLARGRACSTSDLDAVWRLKQLVRLNLQACSASHDVHLCQLRSLSKSEYLDVVHCPALNGSTRHQLFMQCTSLLTLRSDTIEEESFPVRAV